ncbi:hypothetical protein HYU12_03895 [Candidatus Woesearchaeota archaeon]|nr:hypothetical protein [Candidatus Woesearchaeota archaeon]
MPEILQNAREEMKRADHLLYVSLKVTRTVDVIKSMLERLINAIDAAVDTMLDYALKKKLIKEKPENLGLKGELAKTAFKDPKIAEMVDFGMRLKQINRAEYTRSKEYRRHVTMTAVTETGIVNVDIDTTKEYYNKTKEYIEYVERMLFGERE